MPQSPFKFLDSYTREDRDIYFGRSRETEALYTSVFKSKMVLLYGVSGTGKSSLIQCGLANKFQESDWLPVFVRRGTDMLDSPFQSLVQTHIEAPHPPKKRTAKSFLKLLQSLYLDHFKPVYLIFDQFEELFIFGNKEERNEFVQLMEALQESDVQVKVIFSIREEYLAMLTEFEDRLPELFLNRIRVERMHFPQAKEVIQGACQYANIEIEEGFEEQLLEKLTGGGKELELTYLQVLLDRLWKKSGEGKNGFTLTLLESMGHISDLLGQFLEEQINELEAPEQGLTVLKTFVSVQGTKKQLTFEEITQGCLSLGQELNQKAIQDLLHRFTDLRILRDKDESGRYELRHDSLAAKIYEKITLAEKELMEVRQFVEQAYQLYEKKGIILSKDSLDFVAPYRQRLFLKPKIRAFIDASRHYYERKAKRRRRVLTWSISIALMIAIVSGIFIWRDLQATREAARIATAHNLANQSLDLLQDDPKQAFKTAVDAYNMEPDYLSKKAVMNAFYQGPFERIRIEKPAYNFYICDKYNCYILPEQKWDVLSVKLIDLYNEHNKCKIKISDCGLLSFPEYDSESYWILGSKAVEINDSMGILVLATKDNVVHILDLKSKKVVKEIKFYNRLRSVTIMNDHLYALTSNTIYNYSLDKYEFVDSSSYCGNIIHCDFISRNTGDCIVIERLTKDTILLHKENLLDFSKYLNTTPLKINLSKLHIKDIVNTGKWIILESIDKEVKSNYVWNFELNQVEKCFPTYSIWDYQYLNPLPGVDYVIGDDLKDSRLISLLKIEKGKFTQITHSASYIEGLNDSVLVIAYSDSNSVNMRYNLLFYNTYSSEFFGEVLSCELFRTYRFNELMYYLPIDSKNINVILNGNMKDKMYISTDFLGDDVKLSKISSNELLLYSKLTSCYYFVDSLRNILPVFNIKSDNLSWYSHSDDYFIASTFGEFVEYSRVFSRMDFYKYRNWFINSLVDPPETKLRDHILLLDSVFLKINLDKKSVSLFSNNFTEKLLFPDSLDLVPVKWRTKYNAIWVDSLLFLSIPRNGSFIFNINEAYCIKYIPLSLPNFKYSKKLNCLFLFDSVELFSIGLHDLKLDTIICKNEFDFDEYYIIQEAAESGFLINDIRNREIYQVINNNQLNRVLKYSINDSLNSLISDLFIGCVFDLKTGDLLICSFDSLKIINKKTESIIYSCKIPDYIIYDTIYVKLKEDGYLIGLSTVYSIGSSVEHFKVNDYNWWRFKKRGYCYKDKFAFNSLSGEFRVNDGLIINNSAGAIGLYDLYFNYLMNLDFANSHFSYIAGGTIKTFKPIYNGNFSLLWQHPSLSYNYENKEQIYLLKLPVTVPRMFEVLQESGLDTTYGFDNIPKKF